MSFSHTAGEEAGQGVGAASVEGMLSGNNRQLTFCACSRPCQAGGEEEGEGAGAGSPRSTSQHTGVAGSGTLCDFFSPSSSLLQTSLVLQTCETA